MIVNSASEFGALVRSERKRRGWSQKELAFRVGVSPLWISQFERGKSTVHIGLVLRALKTLDVRLWVGDMPPASSRGEAGRVDLDALLQTGSVLTRAEREKQADEEVERRFKKR